MRSLRSALNRANVRSSSEPGEPAISDHVRRKYSRKFPALGHQFRHNN